MANRFNPDMTLITDLFAVTESPLYGTRSYVLREASINLSMNFSASCTISVIDAERSKRLDKFSVTTERDEIYSAFRQNTPVKVFQTMEDGRGRRNELLFDGYVYRVDRHVNSDPSTFAVGVDVVLVTAATAYAREAANLISSIALTNNTAYGPGVRFIDALKVRRNLTKRNLEMLLKNGAGMDLVKFLCDVVETIMALSPNKASNAWRSDGKPEYTDLRKFIISYVRLASFLKPIAGPLAVSTLQKLCAALTAVTPVEGILHLCRHFCIAFAPTYIGNTMKWAAIGDVPMERTAAGVITPNDVLSYNYAATDIPWGKYKTIAVKLTPFTNKPYAYYAGTTQGTPTADHLIMTAGYDRSGRLVLKELELKSNTPNDTLTSLGPVQVVQAPEWVMQAAIQGGATLEQKEQLRKTYCKALVKSAYGVGEMFNGQLVLNVSPERIVDMKGDVGEVFRINISSQVVDPGVLFGRLVSVQYSVGAQKELRARLHLSFDCVRTGEENDALGIDVSDMLYEKI